jgi:aryl sulfotransferase
VVWSLYNHHANANDSWYESINDTPGRVGPPIPRPPEDIRQYFNEWLEGDGYPFWPFFEHVAGWWEIGELPNVMLLHFADLKGDLPCQIRRIAAFLDIAIDEAVFPAIVEHCTFDYMKRNAAKAVPLGGRAWAGGAQTFIHKGTNGRWRDVLSEDDIGRYDKIARRELGAPCAAWLARS